MKKKLWCAYDIKTLITFVSNLALTYCSAVNINRIVETTASYNVVGYGHLVADFFQYGMTTLLGGNCVREIWSHWWTVRARSQVQLQSSLPRHKTNGLSYQDASHRIRRECSYARRRRSCRAWPRSRWADTNSRSARECYSAARSPHCNTYSLYDYRV